jgi:hypothetical protein
MSSIGIDPAYIGGLDPCNFPYHTFMVKTRASASFTAQLKDFAGPFEWGFVNQEVAISGNPILSCANPTALLTADPPRTDIVYQWSTIDGEIVGNPTGVSITAAKPGTYNLGGTLPTTCPLEPVSITVYYDPTKPFFDEPILTPSVSCGGTQGSVQLTVTGGTPPYTYLWSNGATTQNISNLVPGTYSVTITDAILCTKASSVVTVTNSTPATIVPTITNLDCYGDSDGSISIAVTSGKSPYTYLWSNGNTTTTISNLVAGNYTVTVTDADGCPHTLTASVTQPAAVSSSAVRVHDTDPDPVLGTGTITLTPSGGTGPYTYSWSGPNSFTSTSKDISALDYGEYTVTITDSKGCTGTSAYVIFEPEVCNDNIDNDGDGLVDCEDNNCTPPTPGAITADDTTPCTGDAITYTVPENAAYDSYVWTLPATASGSSTTNTIVVTWNSVSGGIICVRGKKYACLSAPTCITVTPHDVPSQPQPIIKN